MESRKKEPEKGLSINFLAESDEFVEQAKAYNNIWQEDGERITRLMREISGLSFKKRLIDATIFEGISQSYPLKLRASYTNEIKKTTLIHELGHVLFSDNSLKFADSLEVHKILNLILYDILESLYGKDLADKNVSVESGRGETYKEAWNWALAFTRDERKYKFSELLKMAK